MGSRVRRSFSGYFSNCSVHAPIASAAQDVAVTDSAASFNKELPDFGLNYNQTRRVTVESLQQVSIKCVGGG